MGQAAGRRQKKTTEKEEESRELGTEREGT